MPLAGIDEMPKSQIEKRKRNMESTSRVSRREKRNVEICFLVREENENFCQKNGEILNIFSSFEKRKRNFANKSHDSRGDRDVEISNFLWREREIHHSHFSFFFCPKNANLRHKRSFDAQIQNKDCVFDNTITKVQ